MPQFAPSIAKIAGLSIPVSPAGVSCNAELYLTLDGVTKAATSGLIPFTSTGIAQNISLPITLPAALNTYLARILISSGESQLGAYQAIDNVVIVTPVVPPFTMSITGIATQVDQYATAYWIAEITALIKNNNSVPVTHNIRIAKCRPGQQDENDPASYTYARYWSGALNTTMSLTLQPGQSVSVVSPYYIPYAWAGGNYVATEDLMYHSGTRIRYAWRVFDELNNMSPSAYAGSYP